VQCVPSFSPGQTIAPTTLPCAVYFCPALSPINSRNPVDAWSLQIAAAVAACLITVVGLVRRHEFQVQGDVLEGPHACHTGHERFVLGDATILEIIGRGAVKKHNGSGRRFGAILPLHTVVRIGLRRVCNRRYSLLARQVDSKLRRRVAGILIGGAHCRIPSERVGRQRTTF
jgi:hypothetical protein